MIPYGDATALGAFRRGDAQTAGMGAHVYGAAAAFLGGVGLAWGDFIQVWQPFPDGAPGRAPLAYLTALLLLGCGLGVQLARTRRVAGSTLAAIYLLFGLLWFQRVVAMPAVFGTWGGVAEQVATAVGGFLIFSRAGGAGDRADGSVRAARIVFGVCAVAFGFNHFLALQPTSAMVPAWVPPGRMFWAVVTGVAHALGGLALLANVRPRLAAICLSAMFAGFGILVWLPILIASPKDHVAWAGNAVNLALVGAAWILADGLRSRSLATVA